VSEECCSSCGTSLYELRRSELLGGALVCLSCYLPHAPKAPEDWTPYRRPKPPRPSPRQRAERRLRAAMSAVAPVGVTKTGLIGTCPVCHDVLSAHIDAETSALECWGGCAEDAVRTELRL
jgi:hypothetical protein